MAVTNSRSAKLTLSLPEGEFQAFIFDCDGTIADSMPLHYIAWRKALAPWNCDFTESLFYEWAGFSVTEIVRMLNEKHGLKMPVEDVVRRKEEIYFQSLPELKAVPEVLEHINTNYGRVPFAVVSGSTRDSVTASLRSLGLAEKFEILICAGDYKKGKPDPEPFLLAATRLGVKPQSCLVFEDSEMGIAAARAAGMASVKVPPPRERRSTDQTTADSSQ